MSSFFSGFEVLAGKLYFGADNGVDGEELWRATSQGAELFVDLCEGPCESKPQPLVSGAGLMYFRAPSGVQNRTLWRTDGTVEGTWPLIFAPEASHFLGDHLYFRSADQDTSWELYRTDGTLAGTEPVIDLCPGNCRGIGGVLGVWQDRVYFSGRTTEDTPVSIYRTDGSEAGTELFLEFSRLTAAFQPLGERLFFAAETPATGVELWQTDGTVAGTSLVADLNPGPNPSTPQDLTVVGDRLFFRTGEGALWVTGGTGDGTRRLAEETRDGTLTAFG